MKTKIIIISILFILSSSYTFANIEDFKYDEHNRRDPLWHLVTPNGVIINYENDLLLSDMVLEGIIYDSGGNNLAIINGKVIEKGDKFGFYVIMKIEEKKVFMRKGHERFVLNLKKEEK